MLDGIGEEKEWSVIRQRIPCYAILYYSILSYCYMLSYIVLFGCLFWAGRGRGRGGPCGRLQPGVRDAYAPLPLEGGGSRS